mgnify:CR=1 FL=1
MEKNTNLVIIGLLVLIVGFGGGYLVRGSQAPEAGEHMMQGGMMMGNHDMGGGMGGAMDDMMAGLQGKTGDAFDQAFLSGMIMHHQGAVSMAQAALQNAKHQEIKDMAKAIISAQTSEISQMQQWQKSWYNR